MKAKEACDFLPSVLRLSRTTILYSIIYVVLYLIKKVIVYLFVDDDVFHDIQSHHEPQRTLKNRAKSSRPCLR